MDYSSENSLINMHGITMYLSSSAKSNQYCTTNSM